MVLSINLVPSVFLLQPGAMPSGYVSMIQSGFFLPPWCKCHLSPPPINLVPYFSSHQNKYHLLLLSTWCHAICCSHQLGASAICNFTIDWVPPVSSCKHNAGDIWLIYCSTSYVGTRLHRFYQHQHTHKNTLQYYLTCYLLAQGKSMTHGYYKQAKVHQQCTSSMPAVCQQYISM